MNKKRWWLFLPVVLVSGYFLGPNPSTPVYSTSIPEIPADAFHLEKLISEGESVHRLKPDNEARIVWANDSNRLQTEYSIVYLHGFTASQAEGEPIHRNTAKKFGCNLYLSRLAEHGIDTTEPLVNLTVDRYWQSALKALAIGKKLGKRVILMGTSTGATLALRLAAEFPEIHSLILLSPNIEINDKNAWMLNNPWGLQIAKMVTGSPYMNSKDQRALYKKYWTHHYRLEAAVALEELLESSMTENTFQKVLQPVLMLYYYKDERNQDEVVKVEAMKEMFAMLGTTSADKRAIPVPNAGDHVIGSYIRSNDLGTVEELVTAFFIEVLKINP